MNLQEFAALKAGDKIESPMSNSQGEVTEATESGVRVRWANSGSANGVHYHDEGKSVTFHFSVNSTAWMHWSKVEST